jgi:hypothetical protein
MGHVHELVRQAGGGLFCDEAAEPGVIRPGGPFEDTLQGSAAVVGQAIAEGGEKRGQALGGHAAPRSRYTHWAR